MKEGNSVSELLILFGNGFDIANGLKTSYADFMNYLLEETRSSGVRAEHPYSSNFLKVDKGTIDPYIAMRLDPKSLKHKLVIRPKSGSILFRALFDGFERTKTWGDFEETYFKVLNGHKGNKIDVQNNSIDIINKEFEHLRKLLEDYLTEIEDQVDENQIQSNIDENSIFELLSQKIKNLLSINIINFNYTSKIANVINEKLIITHHHTDISGRTGTRYETSKIFHIHGKLNSTENPIIFGYGNDRSEKFKELLQFRNDDLMKYIKTFLNKQSIVNDHINYCLGKGNTKVIVLGHSLSDTDSTLLNKIFKHKNVKDIELIYRDNKENYMKKLYQFARIVNDQTIVDEKVLPFDKTGIIK